MIYKTSESKRLSIPGISIWGYWSKKKQGKKIPSSKNKLSDYLSEETKENFIFAYMTPTIINKALNKLKIKTALVQIKIHQIYLNQL